MARPLVVDLAVGGLALGVSNYELGDISERRDRAFSLARRLSGVQGVNALGDQLASIRSSYAGVRQSDRRTRAEAHVAADTVQLIAQNPRSAASFRYDKLQSVTVAMPARPRRLHCPI